jgi:hypothetical protein
MDTPKIVSQQEWETARRQLYVKEKQLSRSRDALAAERRRMPWVAVEKRYQFDGPQGSMSLLDSSRAVGNCSSTAHSSSPASRVGRSAPASAAPWWPTRWRIRPT